MMNCKPGDLAIIVKAPGNGLAGRVNGQILGKFVRVVRLRSDMPSLCELTHSVIWEFEEPLNVRADGMPFKVTGIADECLRPIRDPGDEAQDEMLLPLPNQLPQPHKEPV